MDKNEKQFLNHYYCRKQILGRNVSILGMAVGLALSPCTGIGIFILGMSLSFCIIFYRLKNNIIPLMTVPEYTINNSTITFRTDNNKVSYDIRKLTDFIVRLPNGNVGCIVQYGNVFFCS